ncbi:polyketide cyclase / dehydrase and lipid transport [Amycolatopsis rhizosphaerae]|uniref:Polyketide cyclase / dehydrase and lipid transport n=1 Tax=Amycolatopsis rhizosphaerae TaxID=2053003 RepID=A0A558BQE4_9PSEU|nr:polyketide cyclase / dehydrase and lipid transport [Amycolatopsis rhizosphaerae]TVT38722.1 polyketide cyclase / dehydrase and lipid transport [Amycolatopsis rhizosphaerae]
MSTPNSAPPAIDIVDETFLAVPPATVAAAFADPAAWRRYWPDLRLEVYTDRGDKGLRWTVRGALVGTMEVWLEPVLDGTLLHYFLRATPATPPRRPRDLRREFDHRARAAKAISLELKEILEDGREPGIPPRPQPA